MSNSSGYSDPTAEKAIAHVMREQEREGKPSRFLPKHIHRALKAVRDVLSLVGIEVVDITLKDRESGKEYVWTLWE